MHMHIYHNGKNIQDLVGLVIGLTIGGLAGFGTMMLLAPQSGKETRDQIKQKSIQLQEYTTDAFGDLIKLSQVDKRAILLENRLSHGNMYLPDIHYKN